MNVREKLLALLTEGQARGASPEEFVRELIAAAWGIVASAPVGDRRAILNAMEQAGRFYSEQVKKTWGMQ